MQYLRHGRWYALTLPDTSIAILRAYNGFPGWMPWQLVEDCACAIGTCACGNRPDGYIHLSVTSTGGFEQDDSIEPAETDRGIIIERSGLTVDDLVPADALAHVAWLMNGASDLPCSRCEAQTAFDHHPLCHTASGVPLFPTFAAPQWELEIADASSVHEWPAVLTNPTRRDFHQF